MGTYAGLLAITLCFPKSHFISVTTQSHTKPNQKGKHKILSLAKLQFTKHTHTKVEATLRPGDDTIRAATVFRV